MQYLLTLESWDSSSYDSDAEIGKPGKEWAVWVGTRGAPLVHSIAIIESKREAAQETKYGQANAVSKIRQHQDEDEDESQQKAENWLGWEPEAELEEPQSRAMTKQS